MSHLQTRENLRQIYQKADNSNKTFIPAKPKANLYGAEHIYRVCAYCRVSTDNDEQLSSFELQQTHYKQLAQEHPNWDLKHIYADATDIIGLKQNPTNGRRFSPIFSFIGHLSKKFEKMLLLKQRRKTEYGKDKAFVDLSKSMNAFRHFREQEALWQTQSKKSHWRNFTHFQITHSVCETMTRCSKRLRVFVSTVSSSPVLQDPVRTAALRLSQDTEENTPVSLRD